jgi:hypothetical protein
MSRRRVILPQVNDLEDLMHGEAVLDINGDKPKLIVKGKKDYISEFINKDEIENKYPTKTEVTEQIVNIMTSGSVELTGYAKLEDVENAIKGVNAEISELEEAIDDAAATTKGIIVEGGEWADDVKKVFTDGKVPIGTTWESFLESMLCVEKFVDSITSSNTLTVTCKLNGGTLSGNDNKNSMEVGSQLKLNSVATGITSASQTISISGMKYGYKLSENGTLFNNAVYNENLNPERTHSSSSLKETFTRFTDENGNLIGTKEGSGILSDVIMYVADGENKVTISQTGDTYQGSITSTAKTIYIATNLKNFYKSDKVTPNIYNISVTPTSGTATDKITHTIYGYRKTFYGVTSLDTECSGDFIREVLSSTNSGVTNGGKLSIVTKNGISGNRMIIASPLSIKSVKNETGTQDITQILTNTCKTINVPGANNYSPMEYNVYDNTWKESFGNDTWIITFN